MSIAFKISTLVIRTLAKPISVTLKSQAKQHASFRKLCINIAQTTHRFDINMRMNLLGEKGLQHVRPLNEAKAIDSGANFISETFLFSVAGSLILFESWRSRRKENTRREGVSDAIEALQNEVEDLRALLDTRIKMEDKEKVEVSHDPASPQSTTSNSSETTRRPAVHTVSQPTDPTALLVLGKNPDYRGLVRARISQVRSGTIDADF